MRLVAVRQILRRLRTRLREMNALLGESPAATRFDATSAVNDARRDRLARAGFACRDDCELALAAIDAELREPSDDDCVRQQLMETVSVCVRELSLAHPWGSTSA